MDRDLLLTSDQKSNSATVCHSCELYGKVTTGTHENMARAVGHIMSKQQGGRRVPIALTGRIEERQEGSENREERE
jgi:hypothetical protein